MNIVESLRKVENQIFNERDERHDLVGAYLSEDVDKDKLWEMLKDNDIDSIIKYLEEDWNDYDDVEIEGSTSTYPWAFVKAKGVTDYDGFWTDYTMWREVEEGGKPTEHFVFIFGDNDLYNPENADWDWECDSTQEAVEWFDDYNGFEDEDLDESLKEDYFGDMVDTDDYRSNESDRDFVGKKLWTDCSDIFELIPEIDAETGKRLEKYLDWADDDLYRTDDDVFIVNPLSDDAFGYKGFDNFIKAMTYQMDETEKAGYSFDESLKEDYSASDLERAVKSALSRFGFDYEHGYSFDFITKERGNKPHLEVECADGLDWKDYKLISRMFSRGPSHWFNGIPIYVSPGKEHIDGGLLSVLFSPKYDDIDESLKESAGDERYSVSSYYDSSLRGLEDSADFNDLDEVYDWIWDKCSQGCFVKLKDWELGNEDIFRPVEEDDIDVTDLLWKRNGRNIVRESLR